jgi:hypothetical protein
VKNDQSVIETERLGIQGGNILSVGDKNGKVKHLVGEDELLKLSVEGNSILALEEGSFSHLSQEDKQKAIAKMAKILNLFNRMTMIIDRKEINRTKLVF